MNLPNKITLFRILLIPVIIVIGEISALQQQSFIFEGLTLGNFILLILFIICVLSDFLDGYLARKYNLITDFGKFADPLADKMVVLALMIILLEQGMALNGWMVTVILAREFIVTGFRVIAASKNIVIAAGWLGKIKTNLQFLMVIMLLITGLMQNNVIAIINLVIIYATVFMTILSGITYIVKNKQVILESK